jgi:hypothetical protein
MAFDEQFLRERQAKQADWGRRGVRTGSGRMFTSEVDARLAAGGFGVTAKPEQRGRIKKSGKKKVRPIGSPHAMALAKQAANPALRTGAIVNGKKKAANHEHWEQVMVFDWLYRIMPAYYDDFAAIPNGGLRDNKTAGELYDEGVKSGYPDITGDVPCGIYHGLYIELKYGKGKPSDNQKAALSRKTARGYFCALCYGHEEAIAVIKEYLALAAGGVMVNNKWAELWSVESDQ